MFHCLLWISPTENLSIHHFHTAENGQPDLSNWWWYSKCFWVLAMKDGISLLVSMVSDWKWCTWLIIYENHPLLHSGPARPCMGRVTTASFHLSTDAAYNICPICWIPPSYTQDYGWNSTIICNATVRLSKVTRWFSCCCRAIRVLGVFCMAAENHLTLV